MFEEYTRVLSQRYPDIRIEGENFLPQPLYRWLSHLIKSFCIADHTDLWTALIKIEVIFTHKLKLKWSFCLFIFRHTASFLSVFKLAVIGLIILGKSPFTFFHMETPGIWLWAQENKVFHHHMKFIIWLNQWLSSEIQIHS